MLAAHKPFKSMEDSLIHETDVHTDSIQVEVFPKRVLVADTDIGKELSESIEDLKCLLDAYRGGYIRETH